MKALGLFVILLIAIPMMFLNPMGREAFLGYYLGVIATWAAYVVAFRVDRTSVQTAGRSGASVGSSA